jgi:hypothetical protein
VSPHHHRSRRAPLLRRRDPFLGELGHRHLPVLFFVLQRTPNIAPVVQVHPKPIQTSLLTTIATPPPCFRPRPCLTCMPWLGEPCREDLACRQAATSRAMRVPCACSYLPCCVGERRPRAALGRSGITWAVPARSRGRVLGPHTLLLWPGHNRSASRWSWAARPTLSPWHEIEF